MINPRICLQKKGGTPENVPLFPFISMCIYLNISFPPCIRILPRRCIPMNIRIPFRRTGAFHRRNSFRRRCNSDLCISDSYIFPFVFSFVLYPIMVYIIIPFRGIKIKHNFFCRTAHVPSVGNIFNFHGIICCLHRFWDTDRQKDMPHTAVF